MTELKITKGNLSARWDGNWPHNIIVHDETLSIKFTYPSNYVCSAAKSLADHLDGVGFDQDIRDHVRKELDKQFNDAKLHAEASTVATQTGLTPRQLLSAILEIEKQLDYGQIDAAIKICNEVVSKAEGRS